MVLTGNILGCTDGDYCYSLKAECAKINPLLSIGVSGTTQGSTLAIGTAH